MAVERATSVDHLHPLDLLALEELQDLQDSLAAALGLYASLCTPVGRPLTRPLPLPPVCELLSQTVCRDPDLLCGFAGSQWRCALADGAVRARCPMMDLQIAAVPLRVCGRQLATLVLGRVPSAVAGDEWLHQKALRLKVEEGRLRAALEAMGPVDELRFGALVAHTERVVQTLAALAESRVAEQQASRALQTTNRRLGSLGAIAAGIIRSPTWQESLGQALQTILEVLRLDSGAIYMRGEDGATARLAAHCGVGPEFVAVADSELFAAVPGGQILQGSLGAWVVPDVARDPQVPAQLLRRLRIQALVVAPLRAGDTTLGWITLHASQPRAFHADDVAMIEAAAEQLGIGVQGLRLLAAEKRRAGELATLNEVAMAVSKSLDLQVILDQALVAISSSFRAGAGLIYLLDESGEAPILVAHCGLSAEIVVHWAGHPPVGWDAQRGLDQRARWGSSLPTASTWSHLVVAEGLMSYVSAPLGGQRRVRGLLVAFTREPRVLSVSEVQLFQAVAHEVGLAVENAQLHRETQRRLADLEALQHFNERILHTMQEGILIVNMRGRIGYVTPRLAELTGYAVDELMDCDWRALAHADDWPLLDKLLEATVAGHSRRIELGLVRKGGEGRHVSLGAVPLSEAGVVTGVLGVLIDLTEEMELRRRLRQAEKLSAVGEFVSGVAHELNNPLTVIRGYAQLLQGHDEAGWAKRELGAITEHAERAARIVQGLLAFAREQPPARGLVDLNALLESVLDMREREMMASGIRVVRRLAPELPKVRGDPYQLQQVFLNIVINAEQALTGQTPLEGTAHGAVTVSTALGPDDRVLASIQDNGRGIPAAVADRIFDPFFTTKANRQGTGLGLAICYGIVNAHGGRIWADSVEGQGATFHVALPVQEGEPAEEAPPAPVATALPAGNGHILVVEDEAEIAGLLARYLERLGYRVTVAHEAPMALQATERGSFDLILTDLKMPGMSGREFYTRLGSTRPELAERVVFVTGDTVSPETQSFLSQAGQPHLAKPFSLEEVRGLIAERLTAQRGRTEE